MYQLRLRSCIPIPNVYCIGFKQKSHFQCLLKEIESLEGLTFRYIPKQENSADLATRGKSPSELTSSLWWNGPTWSSEPLSQ